jgi:hypothetical protein
MSNIFTNVYFLVPLGIVCGIGIVVGVLLLLVLKFGSKWIAEKLIDSVTPCQDRFCVDHRTTLNRIRETEFDFKQAIRTLNNIERHINKQILD